MKPYRTLLRRGESEFIINKSRFIGAGAPVESEDVARAFLSEVRARHPAANHNCFAYVVGANMGVMRYSDDGEPGGTAGLPIIETIKSRGVTNLCVVVTRYFGGVLLGAGGLARAYARGATEAINASEVGEMLPTAQYLIEIPYPMWNRVEHYLKSAPVAIDDKTFAEAVTLSLAVRVTDEQELVRALAELSDGVLFPIRVDEQYRPWTAAD